MPYIATDSDGTIALYERKPIRAFPENNYGTELTPYWTREKAYFDNEFNNIDENTCRLMIGFVPSWEDEPIEIKVLIK